MKILGLKIRGIGCFTGDQPVDLPFSELGDARMIAIRGPNGAGKTTALECIPGALYRTTPSRGPLAGLACEKDSLVELRVELDQIYRLQLQIDGVAKQTKTAAYFFDESAEPLADGKLRDYDAAVAKHFPAKELLLSSVFAAQGGEGRFLSLSAGERKELFVKMLGLGLLEGMTTAAGQRVRATELELALLRERESGLTEIAGTAGDLRQEREEHETKLTGVRQQVEGAEQDLARGREALAHWSEEQHRLQAEAQDAAHTLDGARVGQDHAEYDLSETKKRQGDADEQIAGLECRLEERGKLAAQAETVPALERSADQLEAGLRDLLAEQERCRRAREQWVEQGHEARTAAERLRYGWEKTRDGALAAAEAAADIMDRAERQSKQLESVPCRGIGEYANCPLIADATKARNQYLDLAETYKRRWAEYQALEDEPVALKDAEASLAELRRQQPPEAPSATAKETALAEDRRKLSDVRQAAVRLEALDDLQEQTAKLRAERGLVAHKIKNLQAEAKTAAGRVESARLAVVRTNFRSTEHGESAPPAPDDRAVGELRGRETYLVGLAAAAKIHLQAAEKAAEDLEQVRASTQAETADLDDWQHLQRALGKQGIQALEIDAAGPEVSGLINELLHACYGSRFSVSLETTSLRADGKGTKEVFDLRVIDTEHGIEIEAGHLSGGEQVLVSESLALALAVYNAQRSNIPLLDLFRDECAGALYVDTAPLYIEMLRRALDLGGFHRCFFVSHEPALWDRADAQMVFEGGGVRVER